MEEVQFSEELFSTQDEASFGKVNSVPEVVPENLVEETNTPSSSAHTNGNKESERRASVETETPDLVFSEDIDFENHSEKVIDVPEKSEDDEREEDPVELNEIDKNIAEKNDVVEAEDVGVSKPNDDNAAANSKATPEERLATFPFARIKQIMKLDPDVGIVSAEAIFVVTKAAELFLQTLAKDASSHTLASKKKTMSKRDVEVAIDNVDALMFLEGMMNV
ncbi:DNA polymerase epsilon subunit 4 [Anopheles maculipalpis]|uniref:DNA polymerase epsilon subunit 4 n=1 Tax=Anopheles maculipalpis TaxID=1496333 RepID=UPI00215929B3|nr:DNA polymerase epsilon subunit 4 [Anopheles maculipalpis]